MQFFQRLAEQLRQIWLGMSAGRRLALAVLAAACLAAVGGVGFWAAQPDYRVLYSGLSAEDAGAVTAKLEAAGTPFRLAAGGTTVLVPAEYAQQSRLDLAVEGLPAKGGKGFEIFDGNSLGMTPFMQHVNYGRALQAELARTIMQLEPVAYARVHLVQPEPSPFVRERKPPTASVVLKLKPGATLGAGTAAGIAALVARSVEGLAPEHVTLLDTAGRVLYDREGEEPGAVPSSQLDYKRQYESYLASKAEDMLAQVLGPGRAVVRVTAEINFKSLTETRETYDLAQKVIKKETIQTSKSSNTPPAARGVAGATSNLGRSPAVSTPGPGPSTQTEETNDVEYFSPPKTVQQRVEGAGGLERLTVAAVVNREAVPELTLDDVQAILQQAVGFKQGRDAIKVTDAKLPGSPALNDLEEEWLQTQRWQYYLDLARNASLGVAALVALVLGWLFLRRLAARPDGEAAPAAQAGRPPELQGLASAARDDPDAIARALSKWLEESEAPRRLAA